MRRTRRIGALALATVLAGCGPSPIAAKLGLSPAAAGINSDVLNSEIDSRMGGIDTCVVILDTATGGKAYQYGEAEACMAKLAPCAIFDIPNSLIGLDLGVITPGAVVKWDGSPQPVTEWKTDADLAKAFSGQIGWWFAREAQAVGRPRYIAALRDLDYGDHVTDGPSNAFWQGPQAGGGLTVTEGQQADFIRRFYAGDLKAQPAAIALVQGLTKDETRNDPRGGQATISGRVASCSSTADGARSVSWWVGRLKTPQRDLSFSASIEGPDAPPGLEIETRLKAIFSDAGLLPAG